MRHATRILGGLALLVGLTASASAQPFNVTFQVDMNAAITNCAFTVGTDSVAVRGSFNDWVNGGDGELEDYLLVDDGTGDDATSGDGIYTGTFQIEAGDDIDDTVAGNQIAYKFFGTSMATGYEDGDDKQATVTADMTIDPIAFGKSFSDQCGATIETYDVTFEADMEVQQLRGTFDPSAGDVVTVAGEFNGWTTDADTLVQDFFDPNLYNGTYQIDLTIGEPSSPYKFVIGSFGDPEGRPTGWESIQDQRISVDGSEADPDGDGRPDVLESRFFNNTGFDGILRNDANILITVDMRPAYYHLADSTDFPGTDEVTAINAVYVNGPVMASTDGNDFNGGWLDWDMNGLGSQSTRRLVDDGTRGDAVAGDSVFSRRYTFPAGTELQSVGKFSVNSFDNEGGFGVNQTFNVGSGPDDPATSIDFVFGAVLRDNGGSLEITDNLGPDDFPHYDPYIITDNTVSPPTATAVRRGGDAQDVNVTDTGVAATVATLEANYPNPFATRTTFEYANPAAQHVTLAVYDITGRRVALLVDEVQASSTYQVAFDASELAAGIYVYRLQAGDETITRRMVVVR